MNQSAKKPPMKQMLLLKPVLATLATGGLLTFLTPPIAQAEMTDSPKMVVDEAWQIVNNEFVDRNFNQVNWQRKREELLSNRIIAGKNRLTVRSIKH